MIVSDTAIRKHRIYSIHEYSVHALVKSNHSWKESHTQTTMTKTKEKLDLQSCIAIARGDERWMSRKRSGRHRGCCCLCLCLLKPFHGLSRVCGLRLKGPFFLDCLLFMPTQYPLALTSFIGASSLSDHHAMLRRLAMELIRSPFHNGNEWFGLQSSI